MSSRHKHRSVNGRLARKLLALASLVPFGIAPVLGVAHLALVRHATCPEHGELIEVANTAAATSDAAEHGWESSSNPLASGLHQHSHCEVVPQRLNPTARNARPSASLEVSRSIPVLLSADVVTPDRSVAVLRLAPKASPPV